MKRSLISAALAVGLFLGKSAYAIENDVYKYVNFSSTTTVSTSAVKLHTIVISSAAATPFFVYDSTSPTAVPLVLISSFTASTPAGTYIYDLQTQNGLQINEVGGGPDVTVTYR